MRRLITVAIAALALLLPVAAIAAENELTISQERVDCDTARVTVGYRDLADVRSDKILRIFVDADGDGTYPPTADAVIEIEETGANDSDPEIWQMNVPAGSNVLARLREDNLEGPNPLLDEDEISTPDADCDDASITVRKDVLGVSLDPTNFSIDFTPGADLVGFDETDAPHRRGDLEPGLYVLTEYGIPSSHDFVSWSCVSDQAAADIHEDETRQEVTIGLRAGEDVVCTLTNELAPAPTPTATAVPPATATPAPPQPTQAPPVININIPPAAAPATQPAQPAGGGGTISPPRTGNGGLVNLESSPCGEAYQCTWVTFCDWDWNRWDYNCWQYYECRWVVVECWARIEDDNGTV